MTHFSFNSVDIVGRLHSSVSFSFTLLYNSPTAMVQTPPAVAEQMREQCTGKTHRLSISVCSAPTRQTRAGKHLCPTRHKFLHSLQWEQEVHVGSPLQHGFCKRFTTVIHSKVSITIPLSWAYTPLLSQVITSTPKCLTALQVGQTCFLHYIQYSQEALFYK